MITLLGRYILISVSKYLLTTTTLLGKNNTIRILISYTTFLLECHTIITTSTRQKDTTKIINPHCPL